MPALLRPLIEKDMFYFVVGALVSADNNMDAESIEKNQNTAKALLKEAETETITTEQLTYLKETVDILEKDLERVKMRKIIRGVSSAH